MRISDWSSDVCSSDLIETLGGKYDHVVVDSPPMLGLADATLIARSVEGVVYVVESERVAARGIVSALQRLRDARGKVLGVVLTKYRSEEHTSELQSLMRISYAVFCLKNKKIK